MLYRSYHSFSQKIHKSARIKGFPLRVMFELTYRCNFYCRHCYIPARYRKCRELKTREVFSILGQLKDIGCFYLGFTGGEPFIRKDILEILWYAKKLGFQIIIYTNGSLIDKKIANQLQRLKPNKIDITIPAMSKKAFENISGMPGSRGKVFNAIGLLYKNGVNLGFKSCVLKGNEDEIKKIQKFAESLGALHRLDDVLLPRLDGGREPYRYRGSLGRQLVTEPLNCDVASSVKSIHCNLKTNPQPPIPNSLFECGVGEAQAAITPFGELKACLMIGYPRYKIKIDESGATSHKPQKGANLKAAWKRLKKFVESIKPDENYQCNRCELEPYCKWCPAMGWLYNGSFTSCEPESRFKADEKRQLLNSFNNVTTVH